MKRLFSSLFVIILLFSALILAAFSANYSEDLDCNLEDSGYRKLLHSSQVGPVQATYYRQADTGWGWANATTAVSISMDSVARVFTEINGDNDEVVICCSCTTIDNMVTATAYTNGAQYATKIGHFAIRRISGVTDTWEYWYSHSGS